MIFKKIQTSTAIIIGALLVTISCDENANVPKPTSPASASQAGAGNSAARLTNYTVDGTEGDPIAIDVATRWISNYMNQNLGKINAHFFGRKVLEKMLALNGSMGVRFYRSLDDVGNSVVFATGADSKGQDFTSNYKIRGRNSSVALNVTASAVNTFDLSDADSTTTDTTTLWKNNYNLANPSGIQAHFFGYQLLKQILSQNGCVGIRCYEAHNDAGVQQLLLIGVTSDGKNILPQGSTGARVDDGGTVGDASLPCPSYCS